MRAEKGSACFGGVPPLPPQGTHKGCPYNGTNRLVMRFRTIVGASLVGALGGRGEPLSSIGFLVAGSRGTALGGVSGVSPDFPSPLAPEGGEQKTYT